LTPEDVEYSIERVMVLDQNGGPAWMLLEALKAPILLPNKDDQLKPGIFEARL
jgi:peptide/nickel transport system substrate-binding protein